MRGVLAAVLFVTALPLAAQPRILVVTATAGFRHDSIEVAEPIVAQLASDLGVTVTFARNEDEMLARMTAAELQPLSAVMFVNTTGELSRPALDALLEWVGAGGTFVGFHSASDTWHGSPDYIALLGAEFQSHPPDSAVSIVVDDATHRATVGLPSPHAMVEEIYSFAQFDVTRVRMLLSIHSPAFQPLAWEKSHGRGRVLYSALGHREDVWQSAWFRTHVSGALRWAIEPIVHQPKRRAVRR